MMAETDLDYADESTESAPMPAAPAEEGETEDNALSMTGPAQNEAAGAARSGVAPADSPPPPAPAAKEEAAVAQDSAGADEELVEEKTIGEAEAPAAPDMEDTAAEQPLPQIEATESTAANTPSPTATTLPPPTEAPTATLTLAPKSTEAAAPVSASGRVSPNTLFIGVAILSVLIIFIVAALVIWVTVKNKNR